MLLEFDPSPKFHSALVKVPGMVELVKYTVKGATPLVGASEKDATGGCILVEIPVTVT